MEEVAKTITIACRGAEEVDIHDLTDLQGNLKDLTQENYVKLRNSITEYGFSFPILYWQAEDGRKYVVDAHQRKRTLLQMKTEGYTIPLLPAVPVFAKDKTEAKKKLLLLNSRYGKITREGYDEFIDDPDAPVIEDEMSDMLEIPEIEIYADTADTPQGTPDETGGNPNKTRDITCPLCNGKFNLFDTNQQTE